MIGRNGERGSGIFALAARHDDDDCNYKLLKNAASNIEQVLEATPHKAPTIRPPTSHHENYPNQTNQTCVVSPPLLRSVNGQSILP